MTQSFRLTDEAIAFIRGHSKCKEELCQTMGIKPNGLYYHLDTNVVNGTLTKLCCLDVIARYMDKEDLYTLTEQV